ncbi:MAG: alpha/beta hydrolase family esterase [Rhodothermales bacterium]
MSAHVSHRVIGYLATALWLMGVSGCSVEGPEGDNFSDVLVSGGLMRAYAVHVPGSYREDEPVPLLIAFHGVPDTGEGLRRGTGLDDLADEMGWVIAYPNATSDWAEGCDGCARADREGVDDIQFVVDLIDALSERLTLDRHRVYAVGFSQGGLFTQRIACDLADKVAAVAVVAATLSVPLAEVCDPAQPISVMIVHGMKDAVFPWEGQDNGNFSTLAARSAAFYWARKNQCDTRGTTTNDPPGTRGVELTSFDGCANGAEVRLYGVINGLHEWPSSFDVNTLIGTFLAPHSL